MRDRVLEYSSDDEKKIIVLDHDDMVEHHERMHNFASGMKGYLIVKTPPDNESNMGNPEVERRFRVRNFLIDGLCGHFEDEATDGEVYLLDEVSGDIFAFIHKLIKNGFVVTYSYLVVPIEDACIRLRLRYNFTVENYTKERKDALTMMAENAWRNIPEDKIIRLCDADMEEYRARMTNSATPQTLVVKSVPPQERSFRVRYFLVHSLSEFFDSRANEAEIFLPQEVSGDMFALVLEIIENGFVVTTSDLVEQVQDAAFRLNLSWGEETEVEDYSEVTADELAEYANAAWKEIREQEDSGSDESAEEEEQQEEEGNLDDNDSHHEEMAMYDLPDF